MTKETARLGENLRTIRKRLDLSLTEVNRRTGLALSTLSKVENNQMSLTYENLLKLSHGLQIDIAELFSTAGASGGSGVIMGRRSITRADDGLVISTRNYRQTYLNTEVSNKKLIPTIVEHKARSLEEFGDLVRHAGEEFAYVIEGAIIVYTEAYQPVRLEVGDSIWLDSMMGHAYVAAAEGPCRTMGVGTHQGEDLLGALAVEAQGESSPSKSVRRQSRRPQKQQAET